MDQSFHISKRVLQGTKSPKHDNIHNLNLCLRTHMLNFNFLACFKAEI